jgi:hypothetical protein
MHVRTIVSSSIEPHGSAIRWLRFWKALDVRHGELEVRGVRRAVSRGDRKVEKIRTYAIDCTSTPAILPLHWLTSVSYHQARFACELHSASRSGGSQVVSDGSSPAASFAIARHPTAPRRSRLWPTGPGIAPRCDGKHPVAGPLERSARHQILKKF